MDLAGLRRRLVTLGLRVGEGAWGLVDRAAVLGALTDGPDWTLTDDDIAMAADTLGVEPAKIWTSWDLESTGDPFIDGRPTILPEPQRFSRSTGHRFDASHPQISSRTWNRKLYPLGQKARWGMLLDMVALDVDAGFMSASYGGFQILGENFAWRQAQTEGDQLEAFVRFVVGRGLKKALQQCRPNDPDSCVPFVRGYNGTAFRENSYHTRFAKGLAKRMGL